VLKLMGSLVGENDRLGDMIDSVMNHVILNETTSSSSELIRRSSLESIASSTAESFSHINAS
jgi:hypothetical protein